MNVAPPKNFMMYLEPEAREKLYTAAAHTGESKSAILKQGLDLVYAKLGLAGQGGQNRDEAATV